MDPQKDNELIKMGKGPKTCTRCMFKYPNVGDDVCDTCNLNPIIDDKSRKDFIVDAIKNPTTYGVIDN